MEDGGRIAPAANSTSWKSNDARTPHVQNKTGTDVAFLGVNKAVLLSGSVGQHANQLASLAYSGVSTTGTVQRRPARGMFWIWHDAVVLRRTRQLALLAVRELSSAVKLMEGKVRKVI